VISLIRRVVTVEEREKERLTKTECKKERLRGWGGGRRI
jgi:hypothetical protein